MRNVIFSIAALSILALTGCNDQQKQRAATGALLALEIAAAGVAGAPGADATTQYWSRYLMGAAQQFKGAVGPTTAAPSPAAQ